MDSDSLFPFILTSNVFSWQRELKGINITNKTNTGLSIRVLDEAIPLNFRRQEIFSTI